MKKLEANSEKKFKNLKYLAVLFFIVAAFLFYSAYSSDQFKSKSDLIYISGPFESFSESRVGRSSHFSFRLNNYKNIFNINLGYLRFFKSDVFRQLTPGDTLIVGVLPSEKRNLTSLNHKVLFLSVASSSVSYLDASDSSSQYNFNRLLSKVFAVSLFGCSLLSLFTYKKFNKQN